MILRHTFTPHNNTRLTHLCGPADVHLRTIEVALQVRIAHRHEQFKVDGPKAKATQAMELLQALYEMLGFEQVAKLIERQVIEVAPLAYMRGRTLNNSYIILDESQNTTTEQMKMFLTRIGFGSTAVITGDITQVDLPRGTKSGLTHVIDVLRDVPGISFTHFQSKDVVRHPLVQRIVEAYDRFDARQAQHSTERPA